MHEKVLTPTQLVEREDGRAMVARLGSFSVDVSVTEEDGKPDAFNVKVHGRAQGDSDDDSWGDLLPHHARD